MDIGVFVNYPDFTRSTLSGIPLNDVEYRVSFITNKGKPNNDFLYAHLTEWRNSEKRKNMILAERYYQNKNSIVDRKRTFINRQGAKQESEVLSNNKLSHPFMRKIVNQKANYLLSKEFTINSDNENFTKALSPWLNKKFYKLIKNIGKEAIKKSIAWVQVYYNELGNLSFKRIPSEEIKAFWGDADHTLLEAVLRTYIVQELGENGTLTNVTKVEYYTVEGAWFYTETKEGLVLDTKKQGGAEQGHFNILTPRINEDNLPETDEQGNIIFDENRATWENIPFIPFKYNPEEIGMLDWVKPLIDDYDLVTSDTSNNLIDVPNCIKVVKGYDGSDKEEWIHNLSVFRTAFVNADGDIRALETPMDSTSTEAHLNRLRQDIYEAGSAVDNQNADLGNASGVALKFRYADLDMDTDEMANEFQSSLEQLIWFIQIDMKNRGQGDYLNAEYDILFNTDMIMNEAEAVTMCRDSVGIISDETILANHPLVTDASKELEKMEEQRQKKLQESEEELKQTLSIQSEFGEESGTSNNQE